MPCRSWWRRRRRGDTGQHHPASARRHQLDLNYLKTQVKTFKIDAVIVSRLVKVDKHTTYIPGTAYVIPYPYYSSFYGYYGAVYPVVYTPDYLREDTTVASRPTCTP